MKKSLSIILAFLLVLSTFTSVIAMPEDKLYEQSALILKEAGVLKEMRLDEKLKRQDMVILMSRLYKDEEAAKNYKGKHNFEDIKDKNYDPYIAWAVNKGLIKGFSKDTFGFNETVKVQEFQTVLLRALDYKEEADNWAKVPDIADTLKLMEGIAVKPRQDVSRGLMAAMTVNTLKHTLRGSSMTLTQKLDIDISNPLGISTTVTIDKNTLKLEGIASNAKSLKLNIKPASDSNKTEEKTYDIELKPDGKFIVEISNLRPGKYDYRLTSGNLSTPVESFIIQDPPVDKV